MVIWERKVWSSDKSEATEVGQDNLHTKPIAYWLDAAGLHMDTAQRQKRGEVMGRTNIQSESGVHQEIHSSDPNLK